MYLFFIIYVFSCLFVLGVIATWALNIGRNEKYIVRVQQVIKR